jgi:hypothetical protein
MDGQRTWGECAVDRSSLENGGFRQLLVFE